MPGPVLLYSVLWLRATAMLHVFTDSTELLHTREVNILYSLIYIVGHYNFFGACCFDLADFMCRAQSAGAIVR